MVTEKAPRYIEDQVGLRPVPDPTLLTTQALQREVASLKEFYDAKFLAYDKAITLIQTNADKSPSINVVDERVKSLQSLHDEKFKSIGVQFTERDVAVGAALQAAKEAVEKQNTSSATAIAKSEAATAEQVKQITVTFRETTKAISDKIDDLKERVGAMENRGVGSHATWGSIGAVIASVAAGLVIVQIFITFLLRHM
jgi:hypothetical protein